MTVRYATWLNICEELRRKIGGGFVDEARGSVVEDSTAADETEGSFAWAAAIKDARLWEDSRILSNLEYLRVDGFIFWIVFKSEIKHLTSSYEGTTGS